MEEARTGRESDYRVQALSSWSILVAVDIDITDGSSRRRIGQSTFPLVSLDDISPTRSCHASTRRQLMYPTPHFVSSR